MNEVCTPYKQEIQDFIEEEGSEGSEKWWCCWKERNKAKISGRLPQFMESARADAKLSAAEWEMFFNIHVKGALEQIDFDEGRIYNFDETGFFRNFISTFGGRKVWGSKQAKSFPRRRGYNRYAQALGLGLG